MKFSFLKCVQINEKVKSEDPKLQWSNRARLFIQKTAYISSKQRI